MTIINPEKTTVTNETPVMIFLLATRSGSPKFHTTFDTRSIEVSKWNKYPTCSHTPNNYRKRTSATQNRQVMTVAEAIAHPRVCQGCKNKLVAMVADGHQVDMDTYQRREDAEVARIAQDQAILAQQKAAYVPMPAPITLTTEERAAKREAEFEYFDPKNFGAFRKAIRNSGK